MPAIELSFIPSLKTNPIHPFSSTPQKQPFNMDIWSWISELPNSVEWNESNSPLIFELASDGHGDSTRSIHLKAERTSGSDSEAVVTFMVFLQGFHPFNAQKPLWVSEKCTISSENPNFLPLLLQLLQEIITNSPTAHDSTCPRSQLQKLKPEPIAWIIDSHTPESLSLFFNLVFIIRLFWLCACDAPSEAGSLYFHSLLAPILETASSRKLASVLRTFFITVGVDTELCFMRTLGYIIAKWCIIRELGVGLQTLVPSSSSSNPKFSYATESHGLWILKGYAPVMNMKLVRSNGQKSKFHGIDAKEAIIRYGLAHHQLEAHVQLEYTVRFLEGFIKVNARVDNIRLHVARLGFKHGDDVDFVEEKHFPSRARVWMGPEIGATYVAGLSLGRSTENNEREVEIEKNVKGDFDKSEISKVKASTRTSRRMRTKSWRMDQEAEGNAAIFDVVLHDNMTGQEVGSWRPLGDDSIHGLKGRYVGANRPFSKSGSVVIAGDEYGEEVGWRVSKEMEGSVLKWRIGGEFCVSYLPDQAKGSHFETRSVQWCDEVDLPLIPGKTT
ncbi:uncharacterized protein LOC131643330 [Vicia villosa]|uniref:uncharacterized protein LOC131643330 n=1 Tax=Vicia villosa TaxID=3911 RepID=UPI00273AD129|nr:uncharacterized protein LOC131643330 [Vicia villosa]XP_058769507.1 uncharacterized protein LOC131643330 [Vicia villosa]XP_058769508.1 uncharacterized protein LOC131643330 [Vicia villosa]XP_058769509.1 uncharacterized protein LOC131643330 [Vicia villosa]XP_058769510.1 uncharacterized protein LOC131643330 [Vicia villosa]XP_058769511.1 uncharacterized protein LOC131643330 [Vicia villosa]XP_058769512.1 uncharacterized protein LOC131643330 [Vicia villosa]